MNHIYFQNDERLLNIHYDGGALVVDHYKPDKETVEYSERYFNRYKCINPDWNILYFVYDYCEECDIEVDKFYIPLDCGKIYINQFKELLSMMFDDNIIYQEA